MVAPRVAPSVLIAVLVGATAVTAAGAAPPTPQWVVPPIHVGDLGKYVSGDDELRFRFLEEDFAQRDGSVVRALTLQQERTDRPGWSPREPERAKAWFHDGTWIGSSRTVGGAAAPPSFLYVLGGALVSRGHGYFEEFETQYSSPTTLCGLVNSAQGQTMPQMLDVPGCGRVPADATRQVSYRSDDVALTLNAHYPVPTTIVEDGRTWRLVSFARGAAPPSSGQGASVGSAIAYAPGSIPDESGIEHPFPLSQALAFAFEAPVSNPLKEFFAEHPGAYLATAASQEFTEDGRRRHNWTLTATDGTDAIGVVIAQAPQADDGLLPTGSLPIGRLTSAASPDIREVPPDDRPYPGATAIRPPFATLASLTRRWEAAVPDATQLDGAQAWGFTVDCQATCDEATTRTWIGVNQLREVVTTANPEGTVLDYFNFYAHIEDILEVDAGGGSLRRLHTEWAYQDQVSVRDQPIVVREESNEAQPARAAPAPAWAFPKGQATVGLGLVGILAGLLYYFWPALKTSAFSLLRWSPGSTEPAARANLRLAISASPGIHFQELRRRTGQASGALRHHLDVLIQDGSVVVHGQGGYRCFFPARGTDRHLMASASALKASSARRMLHGIVEAGALNMVAAAASAGVTPGAATHHALRLEEAGLVTRCKVGRSIELRPTPLARQALHATVGP